MGAAENTSKAQQKNVLHAFQPIYYFSRCAGLWPFTIEYNSSGSIERARVHLFDILWFLTSICLYLTALYYAYEDLRNQVESGGHFFYTVVFNVNNMPPILFGAVSIALDMLNRNRLIKILKKFLIFDKEVRFSPFKKLINGRFKLFLHSKITDFEIWNLF